MNIPVLHDILNANNLIAEQNRKLLDDNKIYMVNLLASPGAGKTTFLEETIKKIRHESSIGIIEGNLASDVDSLRIKALNIPVVQINTGGGCHLNAVMIQKSLENFNLLDLDVIFIENVGNLICPASYVLGEDIKVVITSTTEGDDKILKYPLIFQKACALIITKTDLLPYLDYNIEKTIQYFRNINPTAPIFPLSSKTGDGFEAWTEWFLNKKIAE